MFHCDGDVGPSHEIQQLWGQAGRDGTLDRLLTLQSGEITGLIGMTVDFSKERNELEYWIATECEGNVPDPYASFEVQAANGLFLKSLDRMPVRFLKRGKKYMRNGSHPTVISIVEVHRWKCTKALIQQVAAAKAAQVKSVVLHWYTETSAGVVEPEADYHFLSFQQFTEALLTVKSIGHM